jgi:hypothetical protein
MDKLTECNKSCESEMAYVREMEKLKEIVSRVPSPEDLSLIVVDPKEAWDGEPSWAL